MALITSKPIITISKEEMKKHIEELEKNTEKGLESLSPQKKAIRKEVQDAKRHREFMKRVADNEAKDLANAVATSEIVSIAVGETVKTAEFSDELATAGIVKAIPNKYAQIAAPFAGRITRSFVHLGQHVKKNEAIFEINSPDFFAYLTFFDPSNLKPTLVAPPAFGSTIARFDNSIGCS